MEKQKVYAVWRGEYSDYRIVAIFQTREKAQECCAVFNDAGVTEYELDSFEDSKDLYKYRVCISGDRVDDPYYIDDSPCHDATNTIQRIGVFYYIVVLAKNVEHARKVAADKYAMFKAVKDTHFPLIDQECVETGSYLYRDSRPVYDMATFEILLSGSQHLRKGYKAVTRTIGRNG